MKVVIFGATGMVGKGVLLECLEDARVEHVLLVSRHPTDVSHSKIREIVSSATYADTIAVEQDCTMPAADPFSALTETWSGADAVRTSDDSKSCGTATTIVTSPASSASFARSNEADCPAI